MRKKCAENESCHNVTNETGKIIDGGVIMANKALKPCAFPGCPELTKGKFCFRHRPKEQRRTDEAVWRRWYFAKKWRERSKLHLLQEPFCRECAKRGVRTRATEVDHIIPHRGDRTLFDDDANLQSLCHLCHSKKTFSETLGRERAGIAEKRIENSDDDKASDAGGKEEPGEG